ncbi:MAG: hypothetical protein ACLPKI_15235 [Streptosporangiaceae bacterium]
MLSAIVARIRRGQLPVPLAVSYDKNEGVYNPPMPLLATSGYHHPHR